VWSPPRKDEEGLSIKVFLHLEAAHPEIEKPTLELTEEMVAIKAHETSITSTRISRHLS
jgi:hypothetical protein